MRFQPLDRPELTAGERTIVLFISGYLLKLHFRQRHVQRLSLRHPYSIAARSYIQAALVFGSFADGTPRFESDLDVAVLAATPLNVDRKMDLIRALADQFGRPVDVIDLASIHGAVARIALTRGVLVFCRDRAAYAERLRRMVYDQADWMPIVRSANRMAINKWLT